MKISTPAKDKSTHIEENLYHHALIRIILTKVLRKKNKTWDDFLSENHFVENEKDYSPSEVKEGKPY